jgi:uncharacterized protein (TIGR03067 family)
MKASNFIVFLSAFILACNSRFGEGDAHFREGVDIDDRQTGEVCPIHNVPLQDGIVPIYYGKRILTDEEDSACQKLFSRSNSRYYGGGCVVKEPKWARVSFCPECRKAEAAWEEDQKQIAEPIEAHLEQVRNLISNNPRFEELDSYLQKKGGLCVVVEGSVKTESELGDLQRLVNETNPPKPVCWKVRVTSDESKKDVEELQGNWLVSESITKGQKDVGKEKGLETNSFVDIRGFRMILTHVTSGNGKAIGVELRFSYELNANKNPKQMDLEVLEGENEGKRLHGIYLLEGDTLKIAMAMTSDEKRPTSFLPEEEPNGWHLVLERLKR